MDREIEKSFSQVLARGKYVHSIVFHSVKPDKVDEYVELVGNWYPKIAGLPENHVHLVGSWRTEVGDCDTFGTSPSSTAFFHPCTKKFANALILSQSTYGNTNATTATTPPSTLFNITPTSPPSTNA